jgi:hypothetical protein
MGSAIDFALFSREFSADQRADKPLWRNFFVGMT